MKPKQSKHLFIFIGSFILALGITFLNYPSSKRESPKTVRDISSSTQNQCLGDILTLVDNFIRPGEMLNRRFNSLLDNVFPASQMEEPRDLINLIRRDFPEMSSLIDNSTRRSHTEIRQNLLALKSTIREQFQNLELTQAQMLQVNDLLRRYEGEPPKKFLRLFQGIKFIKSQKSKHFDKGLEEISNGILSNAKLRNTVGPRSIFQKRALRKFLMFEKKMNMFENFRRVAFANSNAKKLNSRIAAKNWRVLHESKVLACKANKTTQTPAQELAFKKFSRYQMAMGLSLYPVVYGVKEYERIERMWENGKQDWIAWEFGREFGTNLLSTLAVIAVFKGNYKNPIVDQIRRHKYVGLYTLYSLVGLSDPLGFNYTSDAYNQRARLFMEQVSQHPNYREILLEFKNHLEAKFDLVNFRDDLRSIINGEHGREVFVDTVDEWLESSELFPDSESRQRARRVLREGIPQEDDLSIYETIPADERAKLDRWLVNQEIDNEDELAEFEFMMALYYYEQVEGLLHFGNVGWDRYAHSRVYTLGSVVKDLVIGSSIFQMFCVHGFNAPTVTFAAALSLANVLGFSSLFVDTRGLMINRDVSEFGIESSLNEMFTDILFGPNRTWFDDEYEELRVEISNEESTPAYIPLRNNSSTHDDNGNLLP